MTADCLITIEDVRSAFIAAPPAIAKQIRDTSLRVPSFWSELPGYDTWDLGTGTTKTELEYKGALPNIEQGFDQWAKIGGQVGCEPCEPAGCGYNYTRLKSSGFMQKVTEPMKRELITDGFCIADIQTTLQYKKVFAMILENLQVQVKVMKEYNVVFNYITQIAKKFVVDSTGFRPNRANPYVYPNIGTARLSSLNPNILDQLYQWMNNMTGVEPLAFENSMALFGVAASSQVFNKMYIDNPTLRRDLNFSSMADDLITKYNFTSVIQNQFIPVNILYPRRFHIVNGEPFVVAPWVGNIPANYGSYSDVNPNYINQAYATHEEVLVFGRTPFTLYTMPTETNLGGGAVFGDQPSYFEYWKFINPVTNEDPLQRFGYFITAAKIALSATFSEGIFGILVARPPADTIATFFPEPTCPPTPVECNNSIPAIECPCSTIVDVQADPWEVGTYNITLSVGIDAEVEDSVRFAVSTGGFITGDIEQISEDGTLVQVDFGNQLPTKCQLQAIYCDQSLGCSANVVGYDKSCTDGTQIGLILENPISAFTPTNVVVLYYGDGTTQNATVVSADQLQNIWVVDVGGTAFCDNVGGILKVCVPPTTDANCPACDQQILPCS